MAQDLVMPDIPECCTRIKLDVGLSNDAPHSSVWLAQQPDLFVFGFEPLATAIHHVMTNNYPDPRRIQKRWHNRFFPYQVALSNVKQETERQFIVNGFDTGCSSFYHPVRGTFMDKIKDKITVKVWSLAMWFEAFYKTYGARFPVIDHIKIDTQGEDLNVLKGAGDWLNKCVAWVTAEADAAYYEDCEQWTRASLDKLMVEENGWERVQHPRCQDPTYFNPRFPEKRNVYIMQDSGVE